MVNWPIGVQPKHPGGTFDTAYRDEHYGHYVFRSGWTGSTDEVVVTAFTSVRGGTKQKPWKSLPLKILAHGMKHEIDLGWKVKKFDEADFTHRDTSTSVRWENGAVMATDFSDRSGASGVVLYRGPMAKDGKRGGAPFTSGYFPQFMHHKLGDTYVLTIAPDKTHPAVQRQGDVIQVGGLAMTLTEQGVTFAKAESALGTIDSFARAALIHRLTACRQKRFSTLANLML